MILQLLSGNTSMEVLCGVLACVLALLFSITIHEFAHAYSAYKCGDITPKVLGRVSLNPLKHLDWIGTLLLLLGGFGFAKPVPVNSNNFKNPKKDSAIVSIAGVLTNLVCAFVFSLLYLVCIRFITAYNFFTLLVVELFLYLSLYNIALCVFNLIPIYPLDGYNFIMSFVKNRNKADEFMRKYSIFFLVFVIIFCSQYILYCEISILNGFCRLWSLIFGGLL